MMPDLYPPHILDHGTKPRHWGVLDPADRESEGDYPLCGDYLHLMLRLDENQRIQAVGWEGVGCAISQAAASLLGEQIIGKSVIEVQEIRKQDIFNLLAIPLSGNRVRCALLPFQVMTAALYGPKVWHQLEMEDEE
jgi:nitrogen fixation protein NifU and related proteins